AHYWRLTGINKAGHRHMRSAVFSATELVEEGYHGREWVGMSHLILYPGLYVAWYNGSPQLQKLLAELGDSLLDHWKSKPYPNFPGAIFFASDEAAERSGPDSMVNNFYWGLYDLTGNRKYLWALDEGIKASDVWGPLTFNGPWMSLYDPAKLAPMLLAEAQKIPVRDRNVIFDYPGQVLRALAWRANGDRGLLEEANGALARTLEQNMYVLTEGHHYTDRVPIPSSGVQIQRLGGLAQHRNFPFPGHAVSWENTGNELGALVTEARPDLLRCTLFHAGTQRRTITARVWRLEHGHYDVTLREPGGRVLWTRTVTLKRHSTVDLPLPSRTEVVAEFRQTGKLTPVRELSDLAMTSEEIGDDNGLTIPVHNIGGASSRSYTVAVLGRDGRLLEEARFPPLAPPLDLKPKVVVARFPGRKPAPGLRIRVVQDGEAGEICDSNNEVVIR
ncbi:MAG: hypothetical protein NTY38_07100, partial [Acidobacteria bacterium]|nr:hypothetical protein [Acidobacteriota bacterium]